MIGKLNGLTMNHDGSQNLNLVLQADFREEYDKLKDKDIDVTIKKASMRRSMDANSFFWHICSEIAKNAPKYSTESKYDIYREAIRAKGEFEPLIVKDYAVERFMNRWSDKGSGWFADVVDDYVDEHCEECKLVYAYYGSSTYDTATMAKIIDYVVAIAEDAGIPTITKKELDKLLGRWTVKVGK